MKKSYEGVIIITNKDAKEIKHIIKKIRKIITDEKCIILKEDDLGPRKLAYEVKKQKEGYFLYYIFESTRDSDASGKIKIKLNTLEEVIKFIINPYSEEREFEGE